MIGRERKILSKEKYISILPERLAENAPIELGIPKMDISRDKAEVKIYMTRENNSFLVVFNMKFENNQWYIQGWKY